jgi:hypothetical protein
VNTSGPTTFPIVLPLAACDAAAPDDAGVGPLLQAREARREDHRGAERLPHAEHDHEVDGYPSFVTPSTELCVRMICMTPPEPTRSAVTPVVTQ